MAVITIRYNKNKKHAKVKLRFRVRDGRSVEIIYKSDLEADVDDMKDFDSYGNPTAKFGRYNHDLRDRIEREMVTLSTAYESMVNAHVPINAEELDKMVEYVRGGGKNVKKIGNLQEMFDAYIQKRQSDGYVVSGTALHFRTVQRSLRRFLFITGRENIRLEEMQPDEVESFHKFLKEEHTYVQKYPRLFLDERKYNIPKKQRGDNTVAGMMRKLKVFFTDMVTQGVINISPFARLSRDVSSKMTTQQYDAPVFLREGELKKIIATDVPQTLQQCKDLFVLQCTFGCRISDMMTFSRDRISVRDGIPFFRYVAKKTSNRSHDDVETPIMLSSLETAKKYDFNFSLLRFVSGKDGYNVKIKELLQYCKIDRPCKVWNEATRQNEFKPLYEFGSSKLCRKTHEDVMVKVQINLYTTGLHTVGSDAIKAYTQMELIDKFRLMCLAFGEPFYTVDDDLNVLTQQDIIQHYTQNK